MKELENLLNSLSLQVWVLSDPATYSFANRAHASFLGVSEEALRGAGVTRRGFIPGNQRAFNGEENVSDQWITRADGEPRLLRVERKPERDGSGSVIRVVCSATDVTELIRLEQEHRLHSEQYEHLSRESRTFAWEIDCNGTLKFLSPVARQILGFRLEDLAEKAGLSALHAPEGRKEFEKLLIELCHTVEILTDVPALFQTASGKNLHVLLSGTPSLSVSGKATGYRGTVRDVTAEHRNQKAAKRRDALFRATVDSIRYAVHIVDSRLNILFVNSRFREMTDKIGIDPEGIEGKLLTDVFPFIPSHDIDEYFYVLETGEPVTSRKEDHINGNDYITEITKTRVELQNGDYGVVTTLLDITEEAGLTKQLKEALKKYDEVLAMISDVVWSYEADPQGNVVDAFMSPAASRVLGYDRSVLGEGLEGCFDMIHPSDRQRIIDTFNECLSTGASDVETTFRVMARDGIKCMMARGSAHEQPGGNVIAFGTSREITRERRAAAAIEESERKHRLLFENAVAAISINSFVLDDRGVPCDLTIHSANGVFSSLTGIPDESLENSSFSRALPGLATPAFFSKCQEIVEKSDSRRFPQIDHVRNKHYETTVYGLNESSFAVILDDVTSERDSEMLLSASREAYDNLVLALPDGVMRIDRRRRILSSSPRMRSIFGTGELTGKGVAAAGLSREAADVLEEGVLEVFALGMPRTMECCFSGAAGKRTVEMRFIPDRAEDERVITVLVIARDITEKVMAGRAARDMEEKLLHAQKMESVGRLAGGVAHDFNNMLSVILGHGEMALDKVSPVDSVHSDLSEIIKAAQRSASLTKQLLAFARKQSAKAEETDLNQAIGGMIKMITRLIGPEIELLWKPAEGLWPVMVDRSQTDHLMANLCVNARDAIQGTGHIIIETGNVTVDENYCASHPGFAAGDYVFFEVSDTGCGMDRDLLSKVFDPFFTTKEEGEGTGLGLATTYGIVRQNQGFINVYSEPGVGTTFKIYLPRCAGSDEKGHSEEKPHEIEKRSGTVLLVEDEEAILTVAAGMLEKLGFQVCMALGPEEARRAADEHPGEIDLLVSDVMMPGLNGCALSEELRGAHPGMKCLFMSGYSSSILEVKGISEPGAVFIQKPFTLAELSEKIDRLLTASQG